MNRNRWIVTLITLLILVIIYRSFTKNNDLFDESIEVMRGDITAEIFEAGTVKKGEEIKLSFEGSGKIKNIFFREGDNVRAGDLIASLDNEMMKLELNKARSVLKSAEIDLQKLLIGGSNIDLQEAKTVLDNAEKSLSSAIQNLEKIKRISKEKIDNIYKDSIPSLNKAVLTADSAYRTVNDVTAIHFSGFYTPDTRTALNARDNIKSVLDEMENHQKQIEGIDDQKKIDETLAVIKTGLETIFNNLDIIRKVLEEIPYKDVSQTEVQLLISEMSSINISSASITSLIGSIALIKSGREADILSAQATKDSAKGSMSLAEDRLLRLRSSARGEDIKLAEIRVNQAQSDVRLLEKKMEGSKIIAPFNGSILRINAERKEFIQAGLPIVSIVSDSPFQAEVYVYEGDIANVKIGDPVEIEIVAFPNKKLKGEVIFIDNASEIIDGVVNFKVLASIEDYPKGIMFGMTTDVTIIPEKRENVLYLPENSIKNGSVLLVENGKTREVTVETGLRGFDRNLEIISGINEGDRVIGTR